MKKDTGRDFSVGSIKINILRMAGPMIFAQFINVLYNIVDRIFISRMPENATDSVTALGLCLPVIMIVTAFTNLYGTGGAPLFSIARGKGDKDEAEKLLGNTFTLLLITGILLTTICLLLAKPMLKLFGGSEITIPYAIKYITIYLSGSVFVMISLGLNGFINAQGFARTGMFTVLIGALCNIALDPLFIFAFHMGVQGAALATIISQFVSAIWVLNFLVFRKQTPIRIKKKNMRLKWKRVLKILALGISGFVMSVTNSLVQMFCNMNLQAYGGDLYVGAMTIIGSVREIIFLPVNGLTQGAQPIMGYNYGAKKYGRVCDAIRFIAICGIIYTAIVWLLIQLFPTVFISVFNQDPVLTAATIEPLKTHFLGFMFMALMLAGQSTFVALGKSKFAISFSIFRKVVLVIPLVFLLPSLFGLGTMGVFWSEPISELIGGTASFTTMMITVYAVLKKKSKEPEKSI